MLRALTAVVSGRWLTLALALVVCLSAIGPARAGDRQLYTRRELAAIFQLSPLGPVPADPTDRVADSAQAARFGQFLYFDPGFSANRKVSCSTCHQPDRAYTDGRRVGIGLSADTRNTPTVLNAAYNHWFFWDGRADSMWAQALDVMETPAEFGSDRLHIAHVVYSRNRLRHAYEQIFGPMPPLGDTARFPRHARPVPGHPNSALTRAWRGMAPADRFAVNRIFSNLGKAIEAYERELVSKGAPFDEYVAGLKAHNPAEEAAISLPAKRGLKLFVGAAHCTLCHSGPTFTDGQFHNLGLPVLAGKLVDIGRAGGIPILLKDIFNGVGPFSDKRTGMPKDKLAYLPPAKAMLGSFKTPTLRNVALTAPYMHDGRFTTLREVVSFYAEGRAGIKGKIVGKRERLLDLIPHLTNGQIDDLVAFLKTLNGKPLPHALMVAPSRP